MPPRVSVLMTTYNGATFVGASIASVLAQSFTDFELVVVDDGSTDATVAVVEAFADPRVRLLRMPRNAGIVAARNAGFAMLRGSLVAVLDHDDLADPGRLAAQVAYLDANPETMLLGSEIRIDDNGTLRAPNHAAATDPLAMRWQLLVDNPLAWSSVMFRADAVRRLGTFLRPDFEPADDFDFYHRMQSQGAIARLPDVLTTYRYHATNASHAAAARLNANAARVLAEAYAPWLGEAAGGASVLVIRHLSDRQPVAERADLDRLRSILRQLEAGLAAMLPPAERTRLAAMADGTWWRTLRAAIRAGRPEFIAAYAGGASWPDLAASLLVGLARRHRR